MDKIIFNDAFDFGDIQLATIADDPAVMRKCASSAVVDQWGRIDPIKDHTIIHLIAVGDFEKTGANRNGDAFRADVNRRMHDTFRKHGALYRDHKSEDYNKRNGDVIKTAYNEEMGRIELAVACHHEKCAHFLPLIEKGQPVSFSMGFKCAYDECSKCGHRAKTRADYCKHVQKNASHPYGMGRILPDGSKCFVFNPEGYYNDISDVPVGAEPIAMDLRKVAGLTDGEVIGGAELAEQYFMTSGSINQAKLAMARKAAEIEKRIEMIGQGIKSSRKRTLTKCATDLLRSAPPAEMFLELAKIGAVLPLVDFYQLMFGPEFDSCSEIIHKTAAFETTAFSKIVSDQSRLNAVCSNQTYDPADRSHFRITKSAEREIAVEYSIDPDLAEARACKRASIGNTALAADSSTQQTDYLLDQYCAYKLAALTTITPDADYEKVFAALI
jgi:hypothetical protein